MTHHPEQKGFTVWFTGLSGAGKSTVAEMLFHCFVLMPDHDDRRPARHLLSKVDDIIN